MNNLRELFETLEISPDIDNSKPTKVLRFERLITSTKYAIASHINLSKDEWTYHDQESLESLTESLEYYTRKLNEL